MDQQEARQLLGLDDGPVAADDLRHARNNALRAHHPDVVGSDPAAIRRSTYWTSQINAAHDLLLAQIEGHDAATGAPAGEAETERQSFAGSARRASERAAEHGRDEAAAEDKAGIAARERAAQEQARADAAEPTPMTAASQGGRAGGSPRPHGDDHALRWLGGIGVTATLLFIVGAAAIGGRPNESPPYSPAPTIRAYDQSSDRIVFGTGTGTDACRVTGGAKTFSPGSVVYYATGYATVPESTPIKIYVKGPLSWTETNVAYAGGSCSTGSLGSPASGNYLVTVGIGGQEGAIDAFTIAP